MTLNILDDLYKQYFGAAENCSQKLLFGNFSKELQRVHPSDILEELFSIKYAEQFIIEFLLYNPNLWKDLKFSDWKRIMKNINRQSIKYPFENSGCYMDFVFLGHFLSVNPLKLFFENEEVTAEHKNDVIASLRLMVPFLVSIEVDSEKMEFYFSNSDFNYTDYQETHKALLIDGMADGFKNQDQVLLYLNQEAPKTIGLTN